MANDQISIKRHGRSEEHRYDVSPDQLDRMERAGGDVGINFQVAQFLLTLSFSFLATLILSPPASGTTAKSVFVSIVFWGFVLGLIFGIKWYRDRGAFADIIREIRELPEIGPLGDERQELRRSELDNLPLETAPAPPTSPATAAAATVSAAVVAVEIPDDASGENK
jgi:hypothetical protein